MYVCVGGGHSEEQSKIQSKLSYNIRTFPTMKDFMVY